MCITYNNVGYLLNDWDVDVTFDIEDIDYLDEFMKRNGVKIDIALIDLAKLYNRFSEEKWAASWEDNAEGEFIQWLEKKIQTEIE